MILLKTYQALNLLKHWQIETGLLYAKLRYTLKDASTALPATPPLERKHIPPHPCVPVWNTIEDALSPHAFPFIMVLDTLIGYAHNKIVVSPQMARKALKKIRKIFDNLDLTVLVKHPSL